MPGRYASITAGYAVITLLIIPAYFGVDAGLFERVQACGW